MTTKHPFSSSYHHHPLRKSGPLLLVAQSNRWRLSNALRSCACACVCARALVFCSDLLDYLIDYPLSLDLHIWQFITLFRSYLSTLYHIHLVVRTVLVLQYSYLYIHLTLVTVSLSMGNATGRHCAHYVSAREVNE